MSKTYSPAASSGLLTALSAASAQRLTGASGEYAEVWPVFNGGTGVYLYWMEVPAPLRGQGRGTALLREVCAWADEVGRAIDVLPEGLTPALTARLRAWYARHGFVDLPPNPLGMVGMRREPQGKSKD